jgi:hypothetical protein
MYKRIIYLLILLTVLFFQEQKFIYSQNGSIKTFLVAYSKNKFKPGGHIENYSIFDNWPQTDDDRNAF